jgi:iron(III) transport system ATP-binding protein
MSLERVRPSTGTADDVRDTVPPALACSALVKRFGDVLAVDHVDLEVPRASLTALLGPSGCGKTTLLRMVAGLETPDEGRIAIAGRTVHGDGSTTPPERRAVGMMFQAHALFPHLDVTRNVAFGLRDLDRDATSLRVGEVLELVGLHGLERRMPSELSGGQQQRVALARALAPAPALLLLDEPFSSLDAALRASVREEVRGILRDAEQTALLVTHDQEEALSVTDRIGVMFDGRLHQLADPQTLYRSPATREVATFVGEADLVAGTRAGQFLVDTPLGRLATIAPIEGNEVLVVLRPEMLRLRASGDGCAVVRTVTFYGHDQLVELGLDGGPRLRARRGPDLDLSPGDRVAIQVEGPVVTF